MRESSISTLDHLMLNCTAELFFNAKTNLDCVKNIQRFDSLSDERYGQQLKLYEESRGCGGRPALNSYKFPPFVIKTCPCTFHNRARFIHYWTLYDKYSRFGVLPFGGAHADQPARVIEMFDALQTIKARYDKKG